MKPTLWYMQYMVLINFLKIQKIVIHTLSIFLDIWKYAHTNL